MGKILVAPSILSADFRHLEREVKAAQDAGADMIHCDVMDGLFVPNITFGPFIVEAVKKCVSIPLDVHLMIADPGKYAGTFCDAGADILVFHAETRRGDRPRSPAVDVDANGATRGGATRGGAIRDGESRNNGETGEIKNLLDDIRRRGVRPGVAVNPDKSIDLFMDDLPSIDQVVIMSVYAGFGGQKFIPDVMDKVRAVRRAANERGLRVDIQVDGGVNNETAAVCAEAGANVLVAGSYVFGGSDYAGRIKAIRESAERAAP